MQRQVSYTAEKKQFAYQYLEGSHLLHRLTMPNSMTLEWGYEAHRDLVTSMTYKRGTSTVAARGYVYDNIGRPISRETTRQGSTVNDTFSYNSRSELIGATVSGKVYGYSYDDIGNRKTAQEDAEEVTSYTANPLNQYTAIQQGSGEESSFTPTYDTDGNQTRIKTATGIWNVTYNAENRPIRFESTDGTSIIKCTYDYMGRRHTRKVTLNGTVSDYLRYIYRGYLQIAAIDAVSGVFRWFLVWDPTQATATRPLAIRKDQTWYAYGWDITKNVTEIFGKAGYLRTAYTYTPYGTATADGDVTQPLTWSSEYCDEELALIYYNYRHYNPTDGRWINRDPIAEQGGVNLYAFVENNALTFYDLFGYVKEFDRENEKAVMSCYKVSVFFQRGIRHTEKWKPGKKDIKRAKVGERIFSIIISVFPVYERKSLNGCPCKDIIKEYRKDLPFSIYLKAYVRTDKGEDPFYFYPSGLPEKTLIGKRHEQETTMGTILYGGGLYEVSGWQGIHLEPKRKKKPTSLRIVVGSPSINIYNKRHHFDYERKLKSHKKQKWWQKIFIFLFILIIFPACAEQGEDKVQLKEMRRLYEEVCIPQRPGAFYPSYADSVPTDELETKYIRAMGDLWQYVRKGIEVGSLTVSPLRKSEYMHRADKYSIWWYEHGAKRDDINCILGLYSIYSLTLFDDIADDKKVYEYGAKLIKKWEQDGYLREQPAGADLEQQLLLYISDLSIVRECYEYGHGVTANPEKARELSKKCIELDKQRSILKEKRWKGKATRQQETTENYRE